jgi:hypothetical protein
MLSNPGAVGIATSRVLHLWVASLLQNCGHYIDRECGNRRRDDGNCASVLHARASEMDP